jgi:hypothetical protein
MSIPTLRRRSPSSTSVSSMRCFGFGSYLAGSPAATWTASRPVNIRPSECANTADGSNRVPSNSRTRNRLIMRRL